MGPESGTVVSYGVGNRCSLESVLLWLWLRPAAVALSQPPAREITKPTKEDKKEKKKKKKKRELPHDPAIPLLGLYADKTFIEKDTCTCMFIAALFTIVKAWKQPKCPPTDEWIRKMWHIYTMEYYSAT